MYPESGPSTYYDGCIGHDEPGIQFYSNLPGSGGNFSWNVTLPNDTGPSQNQSNLYVAVWFGMTLRDPLGWMDQCFLELQLYPDSSYDAFGNSLATENKWVGAAVAWQIEAANGYEDPCFYQLLYNNGIPGPSYFNMTGGDQLTVAMRGWPGDPYGENITIHDVTSGNRTNVTLYDPYGSYPLDPAFATNSYENGLQWTPGGEYPVAFAFETGHGRNPNYPSNATFNYCAPGRPPATVANPYVPCPSYDPASWANDTKSPWKIGVPTFYGPTGHVTPAQVAFTQDLGALNWVDAISGCVGFEGSEYCSYPWYSYSCASQAFNFGATDYPGVTTDFGKYNEYSRLVSYNDLDGGYYPPTNFTIPTCGGPSARLGLGFSGAPSGPVNFLSHEYLVGASFRALALGEYSVHALPRTGVAFVDWTTSGGASVNAPSSAWATLTLAGNGTLTANFGAVASSTNVTFYDQGATGSVAVEPSYQFVGEGVPLATLSNGSSIALVGQIYGITAYAPPGYQFSRWTVDSGNVVVASPGFPNSWFVVEGSGATASVTAWYFASTPAVSVDVYAYGSGSVTFNGTSYTGSTVTTRPGTYSTVAVPSPGNGLNSWSIYGSTVVSDFGLSTNVSVENGSSYIVAYFDPELTLDVTPAGGGGISWSPPAIAGNNTTMAIPAATYYPVAVASPGYAFAGWSVNRSLDGWAFPAGQVAPTFVFNSTVTLTARFVAKSNESLAFRTVPAAAGSIEFNLRAYPNGSSNASVADGPYAIGTVPAFGYAFSAFSVTGPLSVSGSQITVSGDGGVLTATFVPAALSPVPLTFVALPQNGSSAKVNGTSIPSGSTLWIQPGTYSLGALLGTDDTFLAWSSVGGVAVAATGSATTNVTITDGGALYAQVAPFVLANESLSSPVVDVGFTVRFWAAAVGTAGPFAYTWTGNTTVCGGVANSTIGVNGRYCNPSAVGTFPFELNVTDSLGDRIPGRVLTLVVVALPTVLLSATRSVVDVGAVTELVANRSGGDGPFTYSYAGLPTGCTSTNTSHLFCTPTVTGTSTVIVTLQDSWMRRLSAPLTLIVRPPPRIGSFTVGPGNVTVGVRSVYTVTVVGGVAPYNFTYTGLPYGCTGTNSSFVNCTGAVAGSYPTTVTVTDADGFPTVGHVSLTVNPRPAVASLTASPARIVLGNSTVLNGTVTGGTAPLSYAWTGLPAGCASSNRTTIDCAPAAAGSYTVRLQATDTFGISANATVTLTVQNATGTRSTVPTGGAGAGSTSTLLIVGLAVAILAAVAGVLLWRRRNRSRAAPPEPSSEAPPDERSEGN